MMAGIMTLAPTANLGRRLHARLATLLVAQLFDFATFSIMVTRHGIHAEANPIIAQGFMAFGMPLVFTVKLALVVLIGAVVAVLERGGQQPARLGLSGSVALFAVAAGLAGGVSNALVLLPG